MRAICLYLHLHQPLRYREYSFFDIGESTGYFQADYDDRESNERIFMKVTNKSYRPMLKLLLDSTQQYPQFKFSLSVTGTWLEQAEKWAPDLIDLIHHMVAQGQCEIVGETYYHSLSFFHDLDEFNAQVDQHAAVIQAHFGVTPTVFRNTELAYNDALARWAESHGYTAILAEGWDRILGWRTPNYVYRPAGCDRLRLLLKNYRLSDDIAFRFSDRSWPEWPLTVQKFSHWLRDSCLGGPLVNLFMDFETFGEHQWRDTGIFDFMQGLIPEWLSHYGNRFVSVSEAATLTAPADELSMPSTVTWADSERDLSAWESNDIQIAATHDLYALRPRVLASGDPDLISDWRHLTTSDHTYSMCTKYWHDGDVHAYFSAYASPYESFMYFENILRNLEYRLDTLSTAPTKG